MADMFGIFNWVRNLQQVLKGKPWYLPPTLTERQVASFERAQGIRLPEDYRHYLLNVAGAPPGALEAMGWATAWRSTPSMGIFYKPRFLTARAGTNGRATTTTTIST